MRALLQWDFTEPPDAKHLQLLVKVAEREPWALEHGLLAGKCAALAARALTLRDHDIHHLSVAGLLHDVGKLAVPAEFLQKPGPLTPEELAVIRRHPTQSARIARALRLPETTVTAIWHHHERVDGRGYPFAKRGDAIPVEGQIVALSELVSAFLTPRRYRSALSPAHACARLEAMAGQYLSAELVRAFLSRFPQLFGVHSPSTLASWTQPLPIEALVSGEEATVWQATTVFLTRLLWDAERLFGRGFCHTLTRQLSHWFALRDVPLQFQGLRLTSSRPWWQTLSDLVRLCRLLFGTLLATLSYLLGASFVTHWLEGLRQELPEPLNTVGTRYGLWIWQTPPDTWEAAVSDHDLIVSDR
ncbi:Cyclic di-GMP phosphodiesterase response regulator RpfG [bacterium HR17]|uniref:Cyclic di-GMP phosphodiesterase response regulator RpfG n=1 Tax=Candidatus Fervidibacter japonicus TaxID=2035412 RepID=A0A2H5XC90_9BACT|nr:Cyclic di-GMP phosphodiesterase response regulator RpfG [bacterium HR17]